MRILFKAILFVIILCISWFSGIYLLSDFIWWKIMLFLLEAKFIGEAAFQVFRWIDRHYS